ncbi:MAG: MFS transporter permease [Pseudomonadota bacterium]
MKKITIPKEDAVFWLDKNGRWHNQHGEFEHKKVIDYFHSVIRKDADGYYLFQETDEFQEKVYFPHEDTALFVFDVRIEDGIILTLNTKRQVLLTPDTLYIREDNLYLTIDDAPVKFSANALMKLSVLLEDENGRTTITVKNKRFEIAER